MCPMVVLHTIIMYLQVGEIVHPSSFPLLSLELAWESRKFTYAKNRGRCKTLRLQALPTASFGAPPSSAGGYRRRGLDHQELTH